MPSMPNVVAITKVGATPQELAMIAQVQDAYCVAFGIEDRIGREKLGRLLLQCLTAGAQTMDQLADALDDQIGKGCLR
jgi:hypothetical protein